MPVVIELGRRCLLRSSLRKLVKGGLRCYPTPLLRTLASQKVVTLDSVVDFDPSYWKLLGRPGLPLAEHSSRD